MIHPNDLKEMLAEATANIPEIKKKTVVVTDDELVEGLSNHSATDNILLMAVLPSYGAFGEEDAAGTYSYMQFFFLEKVDYSSFKNQDEYIRVFQRTLDACRKFIAALFGLEEVNCSKEQLQYDFTIRPVARKAQCNGYELQIDSRAFLNFL